MSSGSVVKSEISRGVADYARCVIAVLGWPDTDIRFSGVCLSLEERYFVVTASHCLDDGDPAQLVIATMKEASVSQPLKPVKGRSFNWAEIDMAAFEIHPRLATSLHANWVEDHRVTSQLINQGEIACMAGFPSDMQRPRGEQTHHIYPTACVLVSKVAPWPKDLPVLERPVVPEAEFFVEYSPDLFLDADGRDIWIPEFPRGMSGCPVFWVPPAVEGELWSPAHIRLAGIQSSCFIDLRLLRVQRIEPVRVLIRSAITGP